jgi:hypothetical protein
MASVTVTKVSGSAAFYSDIYRQLAVGDSVTIDRPSTDIPAMKSIVDGVGAGELTIAVTYSANELASGLIAPPQSIQAVDMAPVAASAVSAGGVTMRIAVAAGGAAEVILIAANAFPFKARILDAMFYCSTAVGASTAILRTQAGGGTTIATFDTGTAGRVVDATKTTTTLVTPGALVGLFLTRSAAGVAGEVVLTLRAES